MAPIDENIKRILEDMKNNVQLNYLSELKISLGSLNSSELSAITLDFPLELIFDCLNSSNKKEILTACDVLSLLLPIKSPQITLSDYATPLIRSLGHPVKEVKEMVLREFIRGVGENELIILLNGNALNLIISCLCDEEISVGTRAVEFLTKLGQTDSGLNVICQEGFVRELLIQTNKSDINKLRMYQVLVDISVSSSEGLNKIESSGLFSGLIQQLKSNDILATMASLEVISPLVRTVHGYDFLGRNDIINLLAEQISTCADNPLFSLIYPGLARFFGQIGREFPQRLVALYPQVLKQVYKGVDSSDVNISVVSLETIAFIAYSPPGKAVLYKDGEQVMRHVMGKLHDSIINLPAEWRVRALDALADILHLSVDHITSDLTKVSMAWFNQMGTSALQNVFDMVRQPFPEIKAAAFKVLETIAAHRWGQIKIKNHPGLFNFLLERSTETTLEGKQAKYDVIKTLYNSPTISSTFEDDQCDLMSKYLQEGVLYVPTIHVAVEGAD